MWTQPTGLRKIANRKHTRPAALENSEPLEDRERA
jgi:hypothetical protein